MPKTHAGSSLSSSNANRGPPESPAHAEPFTVHTKDPGSTLKSPTLSQNSWSALWTSRDLRTFEAMSSALCRPVPATTSFLDQGCQQFNVGNLMSFTNCFYKNSCKILYENALFDSNSYEIPVQFANFS